jgi:hypothetical protein
MMPPVRSYIHAQGVGCAVINAVLNAAISWLGNRRMAFVPLSGDNSIIVDTAVTCIVLSLLVSLFVIPAAHREFRAGRLPGGDTVFWESGVLAHFAEQSWVFWNVDRSSRCRGHYLVRVRDVPCTGIRRSFFWRIRILKAAYTAALGFVVTRWVILRQMLHSRTNSAHT